MTIRTPAGEAFDGVIGRTFAESKPWWPPPKYRTAAPNVVMVVLDDTGFSHLGCYGSTLETPNIDALAAGGAALHRLPHHRPLFAEPRLPADRTQPPCRRHAGDLELRHRLSEHARGPAALGRDPGRDPARQRLRHLRRRQVAPGPDGRVLRRRPVHQLAAAEGLRPLLWLHAGRDRPVLPGTHLRQPLRRPARRSSRRLSPLRGHRRPVGRHDPRPEVAGPRAAVLPLPGLRGHARAAPGAAKPICRSTAAASTTAGTSPAKPGSPARRR